MLDHQQTDIWLCERIKIPPKVVVKTDFNRKDLLYKYKIIFVICIDTVCKKHRIYFDLTTENPTYQAKSVFRWA